MKYALILVRALLLVLAGFCLSFGLERHSVWLQLLILPVVALRVCLRHLPEIKK